MGQAPVTAGRIGVMARAKAGVRGRGAQVEEGFVKFPRTPHLVWLGESSPRGDKLMAAADARQWLRRPMSVEEKVDGANLGLSIGADGRLRAQSRGHYLTPRSAGQW